jgi:hypothetical protein
MIERLAFIAVVSVFGGAFVILAIPALAFWAGVGMEAIVESLEDIAALLKKRT